MTGSRGWSRNTVVEPSQNHSRYFYSRTKPLTKFNSALGQSSFQASSRRRPIARDQRGSLLGHSLDSLGLRARTSFVAENVRRMEAKLRGSDRMLEAGLRLRACGKALSDMLALKPYWGKPAVRTFREGDGKRRHHSKPGPRERYSTTRLPHAAAREVFPPYPRGPLAPVRVVLSRSINAYYSPMRQSHRHAATSRLCAYTQRLRCAGAPRRPARPSLLLLPCFPCMLPTLPRWSAVPSRYIHTVVPDFRELLPSRLTTIPSLPAIADGVALSGAASFTLCYGLQVCLALLTGYDGMKSYALHRAF